MRFSMAPSAPQQQRILGMTTAKRSGRIQYADVAAAAETVLLEGARPTVRRVREKAGGSPNDIAPMLKAWFAHAGQRLAERPSHRIATSVWDAGVIAANDASGMPCLQLAQARERIAVLTAQLERAQAQLARARESGTRKFRC
jgi:uncharacterized small protein (DUF1192 family)